MIIRELDVGDLVLLTNRPEIVDSDTTITGFVTKKANNKTFILFNFDRGEYSFDDDFNHTFIRKVAKDKDEKVMLLLGTL